MFVMASKERCEKCFEEDLIQVGVERKLYNDEQDGLHRKMLCRHCGYSFLEPRPYKFIPHEDTRW